jgi:DNA-binding GntR family transcriptional regulator
MKTLTHHTLRNQAAESIRASIVAGDWQIGRILSASSVAVRLGVSITPVREAMLDLENAGLIVAVRNRGYRVMHIRDEDLDEIIMVRQMLEPPAARLAAGRVTDDDIVRLRVMVAAIESAASTGDINGFALADRDFHLGLIELTGNKRLVHYVRQLRDQTMLIGLHSLAKKGKLEASASDHRRILKAVAKGDGPTAERLMRAHLKHGRGIWAWRNADPDQKEAISDQQSVVPS